MHGRGPMESNNVYEVDLYVTGCFMPGGRGILPYKGRPGYVFREFCLKQGIEFIIFCLNQGIDLSNFVLNWVKCLKTGYQKSEFCLKQSRKISEFCLEQGQGMRGCAAPPHPEIYGVSPPPTPRGFLWTGLWKSTNNAQVNGRKSWSTSSCMCVGISNCTSWFYTTDLVRLWLRSSFVWHVAISLSCMHQTIQFYWSSPPTERELWKVQWMSLT